LHGLSVNDGKGRAQRFVPDHQLVDDLPHDFHVERSAQTAGAENIVGRVAGL
jgi:hypothetical protein